jgi:hypothetical protein
MRDLISHIKNVGFDQIDSDGNTTAVDKQGFEAVLFLFAVTVADTAGTIVEESDDNITFTTAASDVVFGDTGINAFDASYKVGYTGYKQYSRLATGAAVGSIIDATTVMGHAGANPIK